MRALSAVESLVARESQPYFVFGRYALTVPRVYVMYSVPWGFNYLLRRLVVRWPGRNALAGVTRDPVFLEIVNTAQAIRRQTLPVLSELVSSPCGDDSWSAVEPSAPLGLSATCASLQSTKILNIAVPYGDTIRLEVTAQSPGTTRCPEFVDLVMLGYLLPECAVAMWQGKRKGAGRA